MVHHSLSKQLMGTGKPEGLLYRGILTWALRKLHNGEGLDYATQKDVFKA
jgi:hypothetical protein